ncbi:hypothetical protein E2C01_078412 [Portunus trituberculatus]|uniref:Uncharacterized protein n=1 Tax=Portunus trituberculatus TaxID=210409 RepID=A0A5B7IQ55_PORTR|nr:hypothetical protein [Portunus trituberculatus]
MGVQTLEEIFIVSGRNESDRQVGRMCGVCSAFVLPTRPVTEERREGKEERREGKEELREGKEERREGKKERREGKKERREGKKERRERIVEDG